VTTKSNFKYIVIIKHILNKRNKKNTPFGVLLKDRGAFVHPTSFRLVIFGHARHWPVQ